MAPPRRVRQPPCLADRLGGAPPCPCFLLEPTVSPPNACRPDEQPPIEPDRFHKAVSGNPDRRVDWAWLVAATIHPVRVAILETLRIIDLPATATDIWNTLGGEDAVIQDLVASSAEGRIGLSQQRVIHHLKALERLGALSVITTVGSRPRRERHYVLAARLLGIDDE